MMSAKKRHFLTLEQRLSAIKMVEAGQSTRKVAEQLGVGRTQIQDTIKRKADYIADFENNAPPERKQQKVIGLHEQIDEILMKWIGDANTRNISLSGPLIQERARKYAVDLGHTDFKASNGWLQKFQKRNNLVCKKMSGERGDVDVKTVSDWKDKLPEICEGYQPQDIFNMDETGIFFKAGRRTTFVRSGDECVGGKRAKNRITVALCASMTGEKLKPLVIGKSEKPQCFSKLKPETLPVTYCNNSKSWMNTKLFEEWIRSVDRKMGHQKRRILMFLDNAPSHKVQGLKNVKVVFLPPNTTSIVQPMDQGIIQSLKLKFYTYQSENIIMKMDQSLKSGSDLLKEVTVLDTIYWVSRAWREVESSTIEKCFDKCGFKVIRATNTENDIDSESDDDDNIPLSHLARAREVYQCNINDLLEQDRDIPTSDHSSIDWDAPASELLRNQELSDNSDSEDDTVETDQPLCTMSDITSYITQMKRFACSKGHSKLLNCVMELSAVSSEMQTEIMWKQTAITDFFK